MKPTVRPAPLLAAAAFFVSALVALPGHSAAETAARYRWLDANGVITYGDFPPRDARQLREVSASQAADAPDPIAALPYELRLAAQRYPVVLYASPNATASNSGRDFLRSRGIPFQELTVSTRADADELKRRGAGDRVPALAVGNQLLREFDPAAWGSALDAAGYPASSHLPLTWQPLAARPLVAPAPAPAAAAAGTTVAASPGEGPGDNGGNEQPPAAQ